MPEEKQPFTVKIREHLHRRLKAYAAMIGRDMGEIIEELIAGLPEVLLKENDKKQEKKT